MKDRHAKVERVCEYCGDKFLARVERVNKGQGRFCSLAHANLAQKESAKDLYGFEKGTPYWSGNKCFVVWYDDNGTSHRTSYARWWWILNVGEIPDGFVVSYKDKDSTNISPNNFELRLKRDVNKENGSKGNTVSLGFLGKKHTDKAKSIMSKFRTGKSLSDEHKASIGKSVKMRWERGDFDNTIFVDISGDKNPNWRGGVGQEYPPEFNRRLKKFIWDRDNSLCQICGTYVSKKGVVGHIHHIDGRKTNNDYDNLILLCIHCHAQIHHGEKKSSPVIMAFRSKLHWNL